MRIGLATTTRELTARHRYHAAFRGILTEIIVRSREIVSTPIDRGQLNGDPVTHAEAFRDATSEELVTRDYLNSRIADVETKIEAARSDIIKWLAGLLIAQAALIAALVKLL